MANPKHEDTPVRGAVRFFWAWLVIATSASIAANVLHATLTAPRGVRALAAAAAVVPPGVLLGSTHSVAMLTRTRRGGVTYWVALAMTLALAGCAFTLSFEALADLAHSLGLPASRAWLWPCAIDVSIAQSTLALLALTAPVPKRCVTAVLVGEEVITNECARPADMGDAALDDDGADELERWHQPARELVKSGVTSKDPMTVARILAEHDAGTPPSTIGRRLDVHHSTVNRILAKAGDELRRGQDAARSVPSVTSRSN